MRLIDADALMKNLGISYDCTYCQYKNGFFCGKSNFVAACKAICEAPTVEVPQYVLDSKRLPEKSLHRKEGDV